MKTAYLLLAILGAMVPYLFFFQHFAVYGLDLGAFLLGVFANGAAAGVTADLLISSAVFWLYIFTHKDGPSPWLFVVLNLTIGLSCALPAYLYARARRSA